MINPSNLYAEKIFSEHPIVLWSLDDTADYISLINEEDRDFDNWVISGGTVETSTSFQDEPFSNSIIVKIIGNEPTGSVGQVVCKSSDVLNFTELSKDLNTFCVGGFFYADSLSISGFEIGYEYNDSATGSIIQNLKKYDAAISGKWIFISETFDIPSDNTTLRIVIKINYIKSSELNDSYTFYVNGITIGQWSEEFNSTSLGVTKIEIPSGILSGTNYGIPATSYGLDQENGYYLVNDNSLMAKNTGIPMVYGASSLTKLIPNNGKPSLVVPGYGFLHENGKYKEYTFESWFRISSDCSTPKKIFGPVNSNDGLYVDGPFLVFKLNNHIGSHYVGEWYRPMLIDIRYVKNSLSILLNGDLVINLEIINEDLDFSDNDNDWLGFWAYDDVNPIDIDGVAIYSYQVPPVMAKRRFVYAQGVEFPENINTAYSGSSIYIDYPFADYTNNYNYPDIGKWNHGILDNLIVENNILSNPNYSLPSINLESNTENELLLACKNVQSESNNFFTFCPNSEWNNVNGYLLFNNFNFLRDQIKSFYGVFKAKHEITSPEILFNIESDNNNKFYISINGGTIGYYLFYNGTTELIYSTTGHMVGDEFAIAIDIDRFVSYFGGNLSSFFGNRSSLKFYVGGNKNFDKSFHGNIYSIGFSNAYNLYKIRDMFNEKGTGVDYEDVFSLYFNETNYYEAGNVTTNFWTYVLDGGSPSSFAPQKLINHTASYTLIAKEYFDNYYLDIAINGTWKDYIPLSYFAQYITDKTNSKYYDLDFLQFNINYPSPSKFIEEEVDSLGWHYGTTKTVEIDGQTISIPSLQEEYSLSTEKTYNALDNHLYTGYNDYNDLKNRSSKLYKYDTSNSFVKSYIAFELISDGVNTPDELFSNIEKPSKSGIVEPGVDWLSTKYEVVDNMIIYPPSTDINTLALVTHLDFNIPGILYNKIKIKSLEYASQAFNEYSANAVGTRFGTSIYPYRKSGVYYNYKHKNPFSIYKKSSPYLYLTRYSGIELKGRYDINVNRGLSIPINQSKSTDYKVMALQAAVKYDQDYFPYAPTQIFEIQSKNSYIKFYMVANDPQGQRAKIYAINANTGQLEDGITFYLNGKLVKEPVITVKEWAFLGIGFPILLDFKNMVGSFRINGPIMFNTISYYQSTNLQEVQQITTRPWYRVNYLNTSELDWEFWDNAYYWQGVLVLSSTSYYGVDPSTVYKSYTGTNKIIIDSDSVFLFGNYEYNIYKDVLWQQSVSDAV